MLCRNCSHEIMDGDLFCQHCGEKAEVVVNVGLAKPPKHVCRKCSREVMDGDKFCEHCGEAVDAKENAVQTANAQKRPQIETIPILPPPKNKKGKKIIIAVVCSVTAIIVVALSVAAMFLTKEYGNINDQLRDVVLEAENEMDMTADSLASSESEAHEEQTSDHEAESFKGGLPNLKELHNENQYPSFLFEDEHVVRKLKELLGMDYDYFKECIGQITYNYDEERDSLIIEGGVQGLYTIMEGVVEVAQNGDMFVAFLRDGDICYYAGDAGLNLNSSYFTSWLSRFPDKPIVYSKPHTETIVGGVYACGNSATLDVLYQPDTGSILFVGDAQAGAHVGSVSGSAILDGCHTVYQENGSTLYMNFIGDKLLVSGDGEAFGGMGVTFNGVYDKISEKSSIDAAGFADASASDDMPWPEIPLASFTVDELTNLNLFLSNFAEANFDSYDEGSTPAEALIDFAYTHNKVNYSNRIDSELVNGEPYETLEAQYIKSTVKRFFDRDVYDTNTDWLTYSNGYYYSPMADGEYYGRFAQVTRVFEVENGLLVAEYEIFNADYDYQGFDTLYQPHSTWGEGTRALAEGTGEYRWAALEKAEINGKQSYYLRYMETVAL